MRRGSDSWEDWALGIATMDVNIFTINSLSSRTYLWHLMVSCRRASGNHGRMEVRWSRAVLWRCWAGE